MSREMSQSQPTLSTPNTPASPPTPAAGRPWARIVRITMPIFKSDMRWHAIGWLTALLALLLSVTYLNVVNSYVNRDFMTAISDRNPSLYRLMALRYLMVFAASTVVAVFAKFSEERLGILWRSWLTGHLLDKYLSNRNYHRLMNRTDIDNPDQRMTEDVKTFTTITLSFLLMLLNASITASAFTVVLWKINPILFMIAIGYSILGSLLTMFVGRKLITLNNLQLKREANFRYELIHVREYADSIALLRGEKRQRARLGMRLRELVDNFVNIVSVNRNLGFLTIGYNYLIQIIPVLIVAPSFIRGEASDFGVISQSVQSFALIINAFSLIVTQFAQISSFAAVVNRLGSIWEVLDEPPAPAASRIEIVYDDTRLAYERLTLRMPKDNKVLLKDLSVEIPLGRRLLVLGPDGIGKSALSRATAGIWPQGEGKIIRPSQEKILFIPQRPYTALGTLRDQFFDADYLGPDADERLVAALCQVAFGPILDRVGGLDVERDWANLLTVGEQQLLGIARLLIARPRFAFLDRASNALSPSRVKHVYEVLSQTSISYVSVGDQPILRDYHDMVLELQDDGGWTTGPAHEERAA
jgi:vitamin B12/bleomycin/antimicrobial peptide transport system ATP-binding/permease protein